jgi:hypothetical protein
MDFKKNPLNVFYDSVVNFVLNPARIAENPYSFLQHILVNFLPTLCYNGAKLAIRGMLWNM